MNVYIFFKTIKPLAEAKNCSDKETSTP